MWLHVNQGISAHAPAYKINEVWLNRSTRPRFADPCSTVKGTPEPLPPVAIDRKVLLPLSDALR